MRKRVIAAGISAALFLLVGCGNPSSQASTPESDPNAIETTAAQLCAEFDANEARAADSYEAETLRVTGTVTSTGEDAAGRAYVVLGSGEGFEGGGVLCRFDNKEELIPLDEGQKVTVEGKCEGCVIYVLLEHGSVLEVELPTEPPESSQPERAAPKENLSAMCTVTGWDQKQYGYGDDWAHVEVRFQLLNTGNEEIDYYSVHCEAYCDGATYSQWASGMNVPVGATVTGIAYIDTAGKKASSVAITDWDLERNRLFPLPNTAWRIS